MKQPHSSKRPLAARPRRKSRNSPDFDVFEPGTVEQMNKPEGYEVGKRSPGWDSGKQAGHKI